MFRAAAPELRRRLERRRPEIRSSLERRRPRTHELRGNLERRRPRAHDLRGSPERWRPQAHEFARPSDREPAQGPGEREGGRFLLNLQNQRLKKPLQVITPPVSYAISLAPDCEEVSSGGALGRMNCEEVPSGGALGARRFRAHELQGSVEWRRPGCEEVSSGGALGHLNCEEVSGGGSSEVPLGARVKQIRNR